MPVLIPAIKIALPFLILLSSAVVFFFWKWGKFLLPQMFLCGLCSGRDKAVCHCCHFHFYHHLLFLWEAWDPASKRKLLPYCWISLAKTASLHLLTERELVSCTLPLSGLVGRVWPVWGSLLFLIGAIFPLHCILSVARFKLRKIKCFFLLAGVLQKIHAWSVRVARTISSKIFLLFKTLRNALLIWNSARTAKSLLGRKPKETSATDSLQCIFFSLSGKHGWPVAKAIPRIFIHLLHQCKRSRRSLFPHSQTKPLAASVRSRSQGRIWPPCSRAGSSRVTQPPFEHDGTSVKQAPIWISFLSPRAAVQRMLHCRQRAAHENFSELISVFISCLWNAFCQRWTRWQCSRACHRDERRWLMVCSARFPPLSSSPVSSALY